MERREEILRLWFSMWLQKKDMGIADIFARDALYIESWGPEYQGAAKIKLWFDEWNRRGDVVLWDIRQFIHSGDQTVLEWSFRNVMYDGREEAFDGLSLVRWTAEGRIARLQEFGCNPRRYDPYAQGETPRFRDEDPMWF